MRILSIQSSVVHGYVGNRAATFPLQLLGNEVSCINTVQFSTHTGYPQVRGQKLNEQEILTLYEGLELNGINTFDALLTGYVPGAEGIHAIRTIASKLKVLWLLDPVMGDEERGLYVSEEIPALYKELLSQADIITPNQFELQILSDVTITDMESVKEACRRLHAQGVKKIAVTTFRDPEEPDSIKVVGSSDYMFSVSVPYHSRPYQGTGDLFAALLLHYSLQGLALEAAILKVVDSMKPIIELTGETFDRKMEDSNIKNWRANKGIEACQSSELRLIDCSRQLLEPKPFYHSKQI